MSPTRLPSFFVLEYNAIDTTKDSDTKCASVQFTIGSFKNTAIHKVDNQVFSHQPTYLKHHRPSTFPSFSEQIDNSPIRDSINSQHECITNRLTYIGIVLDPHTVCHTSILTDVPATVHPVCPTSSPSGLPFVVSDKSAFLVTVVNHQQ